MPAKPTRTAANQRAQYHHMATTLRGLEDDLRWGMEGSARIPPEWHAIAQSPGVPKKQMVTIRLDEDVLRFFRAMGGGHLPRMNAVLRAFMQARLAGVVRGPEDVVYVPTDSEKAARDLDDLVRDLPRGVQRIVYAPDGAQVHARLMAKLAEIEAALEAGAGGALPDEQDADGLT